MSPIHARRKLVFAIEQLVGPQVKSMILRISILLALAAMVAAGSGGSKFDRLYVFGDSYSDTGAGYVDGDGPTAVAYLAGHMGLKLVPSTASGAAGASLNFAVSGAQTGSGAGSKIENALLGLGMQNQVDDFAARIRSGVVKFRPESTLFYVAGGLNDGKLPSETTIANLAGIIRTLYGLGGRHFEIALLPTAIPAFSAVAKRLNPELEKIPAAMAAEFPSAHITLSRWGAYFDDVLEHPAKYGITNITDACAGRELFHQDATPCAAPSAYFYYHAGHPSTAVHKIVGGKLYTELTSH
jgi:hypothetical protein